MPFRKWLPFIPKTIKSQQGSGDARRLDQARIRVMGRAGVSWSRNGLRTQNWANRSEGNERERLD